MKQKSNIKIKNYFFQQQCSLQPWQLSWVGPGSPAQLPPQSLGAPWKRGLPFHLAWLSPSLPHPMLGLPLLDHGNQSAENSSIHYINKASLYCSYNSYIVDEIEICKSFKILRKRYTNIDSEHFKDLKILTGGGLRPWLVLKTAFWKLGSFARS